MKVKNYTLAIIEDNLIIRKALVGYFDASPHFDLLFAAGSFEEFVNLRKDKDLDVLLCDIGLPGQSGIDATCYVKQHSPDTVVVMYTVFDDEETVLQAIRAGASGYLRKDTPLPAIEQHLIKAVDSGWVMSHCMLINR